MLENQHQTTCPFLSYLTLFFVKWESRSWFQFEQHWKSYECAPREGNENEYVRSRKRNLKDLPSCTSCRVHVECRFDNMFLWMHALWCLSFYKSICMITFHIHIAYVQGDKLVMIWQILVERRVGFKTGDSFSWKIYFGFCGSSLRSPSDVEFRH